MKAEPDARFDFELLEPWEEIIGCGSETVAELRRELRPDHILHGCEAEAWAKRCDCDDVLFRIHGLEQELAVVHLTWAGRTDANKGWPSTELFTDMEDWKTRCMAPDHEDYTA